MTEDDVKKNCWNETRSNMSKALEHFEFELSKIRAGRASATMAGRHWIDAYGTKSPIYQMGNISTPDARTISIQPWDATMLLLLKKAILQANIGITPQNDGKIIRLNFTLWLKSAERICETGQNASRELPHLHSHCAQRGNEKAKKLQKTAFRRIRQKMRNRHTKYNQRLLSQDEKHWRLKEKEIMTV